MAYGENSAEGYAPRRGPSDTLFPKVLRKVQVRWCGGGLVGDAANELGTPAGSRWEVSGTEAMSQHVSSGARRRQLSK